MSQFWNRCRFCGEIAGDGLVKYSVRHYAHFACYLDAGKKLSDLRPWQVGKFPYRLLEKHNLIEEAKRILQPGEHQ